MAFNIMDAIKNRPERDTASPAENEKRINIEYISVKNIVPAKDSRNYYSTEDVETLKSSIAVHGIKQNLLIKAIEGGKYELIAGERRWRASSALFEEGRDDCEFVPCAVERPSDDLDQRLLLTTTNSTARELTDYEKGLQVKEMNEILDEYERRGAIIEGPRRELIQKHLGLSSGQIGRYTAIHNSLSEALMKEYVKKEIGVSIAYELSKLPEGKQTEAYRLYLEQGGLSIKDVKQFQEIKENLKALEEQGQTQIDEFTAGGELSESDTEEEKSEKHDVRSEPSIETPATNIVNKHGIYLDEYITKTKLDIPLNYGEITIEIAHDPRDDKYRASYASKFKNSSSTYKPSISFKPYDTEKQAFDAMIDRMHLMGSADIKEALLAGGYTKEQITTQVRGIEIVEPEKSKENDYYDKYGRLKADKYDHTQQYRKFDEIIEVKDNRLPEGGFRLYLVLDKEDGLWRSSAASGFIEAGAGRWPHRDADNPKDSKIYPAFAEKEDALQHAVNKMLWYCNQEQADVLKSMGYKNPDDEKKIMRDMTPCEAESEEPIDKNLLQIEAAKYTMGVLEKAIEKCNIEIQYAEEQGKTAKRVAAVAKISYLGAVMIEVQKDLFEMTGDDMFKE